MSTFRQKPTKLRVKEEIKTLDENHRQKMSKFTKNHENLPNLKNMIIKYQEELDTLESIERSEFTNEDIKHRAYLREQISVLENDIITIESGVNELEYYTQTFDIIETYYNIIEKEDELLKAYYDEISDKGKDNSVKSDTHDELFSQGMDRLDKLNKLSQKDRKKAKKPSTRRRKKKQVGENSRNIMSCFSVPVEPQVETNSSVGEESIVNSEIERIKNEQSRAELHNRWRLLQDDEYIYESNRTQNMILYCEFCGCEKMIKQNEGLYVCGICGDAEPAFLEIDKKSYKESSTQEKPGYPYKRSNHLSEWLSQFQGKESIDIAPHIYNDIEAELRKERITDFTNISLELMKEILRKLGLTRYYEHRVHIISQISGIPPPTISRNTEEKIKQMFRAIQEPFLRHKPARRVNFLSYSYVLHKFFELLERDDLVRFFPLLKSHDKLRQQDRIWKKICEDLRWQYIPSI